MSFAKALEYELEPVKASKKSDVRVTAKNRAVAGLRELDTFSIAFELVKRHWVRGLALAYVVEQGLHFARFLGVI